MEGRKNLPIIVGTLYFIRSVRETRVLGRTSQYYAKGIALGIDNYNTRRRVQ